jgi:peptide/nickel transport system permease protein
MLDYIIRRVLFLVPLLVIISIIVFAIIQIPPGDFMNYYVNRMAAAGYELSEDEVMALRQLFGLDKPIYIQYFIWVKNMFRGNFGLSFSYLEPVSKLLLERVPLTALIFLLTTLFVWLMAVPIGIYSARHQYSLFDYFWTFVGFIGVATPPFLLALVVIWIAFSQFEITVIGLFSPEFEAAPWSLGKMVDLLKHIWAPVVIIGMSGTAGLIRIMRGTLLDELNKQYVITARAKGLSESRLLIKYPVRVAINPIISTIGWMLPGIISGEILVSTVMSIPTTGPLLLQALLNQDMYLAGSILFILSILTVVGTLISDILLAVLDPRIRFE